LIEAGDEQRLPLAGAALADQGVTRSPAASGPSRTNLIAFDGEAEALARQRWQNRLT
jgi:hypothetical protein